MKHLLEKKKHTCSQSRGDDLEFFVVDRRRVREEGPICSIFS